MSNATEKHFSPQEIAEMWGLSRRTISDMFRELPGVLKYEKPRLRGRRGYVTLRIPASLVEQAHRRLTGREKVKGSGS